MQCQCVAIILVKNLFLSLCRSCAPPLSPLLRCTEPTMATKVTLLYIVQNSTMSHKSKIQEVYCAVIECLTRPSCTKVLWLTGPRYTEVSATIFYTVMHWILCTVECLTNLLDQGIMTYCTKVYQGISLSGIWHNLLYCNALNLLYSAAGIPCCSIYEAASMKHIIALVCTANQCGTNILYFYTSLHGRQ